MWEVLRGNWGKTRLILPLTVRGLFSFASVTEALQEPGRCPLSAGRQFALRHHMMPWITPFRSLQRNKDRDVSSCGLLGGSVLWRVTRGTHFPHCNCEAYSKTGCWMFEGRGGGTKQGLGSLQMKREDLEVLRVESGSGSGQIDKWYSISKNSKHFYDACQTFRKFFCRFVLNTLFTWYGF